MLESSTSQTSCVWKSPVCQLMFFWKYDTNLTEWLANTKPVGVDVDDPLFAVPNNLKGGAVEKRSDDFIDAKAN